MMMSVFLLMLCKYNAVCVCEGKTPFDLICFPCTYTVDLFVARSENIVVMLCVFYSKIIRREEME